MEEMKEWKNGMAINHILLSPYTESNVMLPQCCHGISRILLMWNGLQLAVQNKWGGHDSQKKSEQLMFDIVSLFCQSKGIHL